MAFALSATPTAGTGTVSMGANTYTVVGIGTNFTGQALLNKIVLIGGLSALVTNVASPTTLTVNRAPAYPISGASFSFVNNGTRINQTATDANPGSIGSVPGVTTYFDGADPLIRKYDLGALPLNIQGTLTIPDGHWIYATGGAPGTAVETASTGRLIIDGRYTVSRTDGATPTTYSLRCGIVIRKQSGVPYQTSTILFQNGSQFEQYGGVLESSGAIRWVSSATSEVNIVQGTWYVYDRNNNGYMNIYFNLTKLNIDGLTIFSNGAAYPGILQNLAPGYEVKGFAVKGGLAGITAIDGQTALVRIDNFVGGESKFDFLVRSGGIVQGDGPVGGYDFYDANIGNSLLPGTNSVPNQTTGRARHFVKYSPTFLNAVNFSGIQGGVLYLKDSDSGNRIVNNGVPADRTYLATSGVGGVFSVIGLLTKVWSGIGVFNMNQDVRIPIGGYFWAYGYRGTPVNVDSAIGPQKPVLYAPVDTDVTLSASAAATELTSKYTINPVTKRLRVTANGSNFDRAYGSIVAYKCQENLTNITTPTPSDLILTPQGNALAAFTGWTLEVADGVTFPEGTKFKKVNFDSVEVGVGGKIDGLYETLVGPNTRVRFTNLQ